MYPVMLLLHHTIFVTCRMIKEALKWQLTVLCCITIFYVVSYHAHCFALLAYTAIAAACCKCISLLYFAVFGFYILPMFMDFIPFDCEPLNGNNRIQTKDSGGIKKKRPVDDADQVR